MKNKKEQNELNVICELQDPKLYKYPMNVKYEPEFFINNLYAKEYILAFQRIFKKHVKLPYEKKVKPVEKDLNIMVNKFRKEGKVFLRDEVDLTPQGKFPQRLVNNQIVILPGMVRIKNDNQYNAVVAE